MKKSNKPYIVTNPEIEDMAKVIQKSFDDSYYGGYDPDAEITAEDLWNAGYRKQDEAFSQPHENGGEWISVEDRLPESTKMVLCYTPCDGYIFVGYYQEVEPNPYWKSHWNIITAMRSTKKITKKVTHWMPLPEAPKMKGGK